MQERFDLYLDNCKEVLKNLLAPFAEIFSILGNPWISFFLIAGIFIVLLGYCICRKKSSLKEQMQKPKVLTLCALLMALNIVLGYFTIRFSSYLRVGFGFLTQPIIGMLFGPVVCCVTGIFQDIVSLMLNPTGAYIPAYGLSVGISGIFHGLLLYKKPVKFWRVLLDVMLVVLVGNIILNSIALAPTVASGFVGILPSRILKNLLLLPIQAVLNYLVLKFVQSHKLFQDIR